MGIFINVVNQKMYITSTLDDIVAGSQEFVKFKFNFTKEWDGLTIFAQFSQDGKAYNKYLDNENSVYLPPEIGAGTCNLMLYGTNNSTIGTTNYLTLRINENILISDASSTDISETLYTQLVSRVNDLSQQFSDLAGGEVVDKLIENRDIILEFVNNAIDNQTLKDYVDLKVNPTVTQDPNLWELENGWYYISDGFYIDEDNYIEVYPEALIYIYSNLYHNFYGWEINGTEFVGNIEDIDDKHLGHITRKTLTNTINENSTNEQYPTAKSVYDFVDFFVDSEAKAKQSVSPKLWELEKGWHYISQGFYLKENEFYDIAGNVLIYKTYPANTTCSFYGVGNIHSSQTNLLNGSIMNINGVWDCTCSVEYFTEEINPNNPSSHNYPSEKAITDYISTLKHIETLSGGIEIKPGFPSGIYYINEGSVKLFNENGILYYNLGLPAFFIHNNVDNERYFGICQEFVPFGDGTYNAGHIMLYDSQNGMGKVLADRDYVDEKAKEAKIQLISTPNIWELDFGLYRVSGGCYYADTLDIGGIVDPMNPGQSTDKYISLRSDSLLFVYAPAAVEINSGMICKFTILNEDTLYTGCISKGEDAVDNDGNPVVQYIGSYSELVKTTSINSNSTNNQYTTAKSVYDFVKQEMLALVDTAPETLNTLNEIAEALNNDENFASTVLGQIGERVTKKEFDAFLSEIGRNDTYAIAQLSYTTDWESILPAVTIGDYIYKFTSAGCLVRYTTSLSVNRNYELAYPYDTNFRGLGVINNSIYYLITDNNETAICCFDTETEENYILKYTSMNFTLSTISAVGKNLYVFGGDIYNSSDEREDFTAVYRYDPETDELENTGIETEYNTKVIPVVVDDKIYTFGGSEGIYNSTIDGYDSIRIIDTTNNTFTKLIMSTGIYPYIPTGVIDKKIYLFIENRIYVFNTIDNSVKLLDIYLPLKVEEPAIVTIGTIIYILGGKSSDGTTNHTQRFTLTKGEKTKLVKDVDNFSTDLEYPTAKAVYDFVKDKTDIPYVEDPIIGTLSDGLYHLKTGFYYGSRDDEYQKLHGNYDTDNLLIISGSNFYVFAGKSRYYGSTHSYPGGAQYYGECYSENITNTINESSTDGEYPSAKAVYDAIQEALYIDEEVTI